ncbi:hypothetical protein G6F31_021662 [Rhizopus arrhizus]|nr:hypothetical protein G6F31_021662 [Rhizopus arrhizus]
MARCCSCVEDLLEEGLEASPAMAPVATDNAAAHSTPNPSHLAFLRTTRSPERVPSSPRATRATGCRVVLRITPPCAHPPTATTCR